MLITRFGGALQIKGDVRLISSKVFAARYSMRFPTVVRMRWDKPAAEVQTHEELCQLVEQRVEAGAHRHLTPMEATT